MIKKRYFKTKDECAVTFTLQPESAEEVVLTCDANDWKPIPMEQLKDGRFKAQLRLPLNKQYQFRYLINGHSWANDEAADAYVSNSYGSENGVVFTTPHVSKI